MFSALCRRQVGIFNNVTKCQQINPSRTALTNHYINKKKRLIKYDRSPKNLEWSVHLREFEESAESKGPKEAHMIHLITLKKSLKGRPWWERDILKHFGFDAKHPKINQQVLAKNTLKVNKLLQEVLHMVDIQPFKLPPNLPSTLSNSTHLVLCSNGEMVMGNVHAVDNSSLHDDDDASIQMESISLHDSTTKTTSTTPSNATPVEDQSTSAIASPGPFKMFAKTCKWDLKKEVVQKDLDRVVQLNRVNIDQFPTHYEYKHNQDGKMHRYNFNKNIADNK